MPTETKKDTKPNAVWITPLENILTAAGAGLLFGFALDRGLVNNPIVIRNQFTFQSFVMLRMFLSASATSTAIVTLLDVLGLRKRQPNSRRSLGHFDSTKLGGSALGGALLGAGMALSGSCPGTIWSQFGSIPSVQRFAVALGGLVGCLTYSFVNDRAHLFGKDFLKSYPQKVSKDGKKENYMSLLFISIAVTAISVIEHFFPWRSQVAKYVNPGAIPGDLGLAWDPALAGMTVGFLQLPLYLGIGAGLGASSAWMYISSHFPGLGGSSSMCEANCSTKAFLQMISAVAGIAGGFVSSRYSVAGGNVDLRYMPEASNDLSIAVNFLGGALLLIGARTGSGCTSGHGLTGMGNMSVSSLVAVGSMFSGAILTSQIMQMVL